MILGVDHIALSVEDVVSGVEMLNKSGFRARFVQRDLPNHPAKRDFLRSYEASHSIAYCQSEGSVSVELTQHAGPLYDTPSFYQVLTNGRAGDVVPFTGDLPPWENAWRASLGCIQPVAALLSPLHAQFWYDEQGDKSASGFIRALLVPSIDLSASEKFWVKGFGCRAVKHGSIDGGGNWIHVTFRAPVPAWSLDLVLAEGAMTQERPYLDDPGFPCLALISSHLKNDRELALKMGSRAASEEFSLVVGDKPLQIVLLRGPADELVELIGFSPKR